METTGVQDTVMDTSADAAAAAPAPAAAAAAAAADGATATPVDGAPASGTADAGSGDAAAAASAPAAPAGEATGGVDGAQGLAGSDTVAATPVAGEGQGEGSPAAAPAVAMEEGADDAPVDGPPAPTTAATAATETAASGGGDSEPTPNEPPKPSAADAPSGETPGQSPVDATAEGDATAPAAAAEAAATTASSAATTAAAAAATADASSASTTAAATAASEGSNSTAAQPMDTTDNTPATVDASAKAESDPRREPTEAELLRAKTVEEMGNIEAEFSTLREKYFTDKIESIQREIMMLEEGTHEQYIHRLSKLAEQRDEKIHNAKQWRTYQVQSINDVFQSEVLEAKAHAAKEKKALRKRMKRELVEKQKRLRDDQHQLHAGNDAVPRSTRRSAADSGRDWSRRKLNPPHVGLALKEMEVQEDVHLMAMKTPITRDVLERVLHDVYADGSLRLYYFNKIFRVGDSLTLQDGAMRPNFVGSLTSVAPSEIILKSDSETKTISMETLRGGDDILTSTILE